MRKGKVTQKIPILIFRCNSLKNIFETFHQPWQGHLQGFMLTTKNTILYLTEYIQIHKNLSSQSIVCEQRFLCLHVKRDSERAKQNHAIFHFLFLIPLCNLWPKQMPCIYLHCPAAEKALFHYTFSSETLILGEVEVNASVFVLSWCIRWAFSTFSWGTRLKRNQ